MTESQNKARRVIVNHLAQAGPGAGCPMCCWQNRLSNVLFRQFLSISNDQYSTTSCLANLFQSSITWIVKKCFLMMREYHTCFSLYPLPLVFSLGTSDKSLALFSFHPPFKFLYPLKRSPSSLLFFRLKISTFPAFAHR